MGPIDWGDGGPSPPPVWKLNMMSRKRRNHKPGPDKVGKFLRFASGDQYKVAPNRALVRVDPPALSKKERNKLKREARKA